MLIKRLMSFSLRWRLSPLLCGINYVMKLNCPRPSKQGVVWCRYCIITCHFSHNSCRIHIPLQRTKSVFCEGIKELITACSGSIIASTLMCSDVQFKGTHQLRKFHLKALHFQFFIDFTRRKTSKFHSMPGEMSLCRHPTQGYNTRVQQE